ncbi:type IV toxin-antitoxin system AbiEi family antitoxin domain-containing protein [Specibacter sp. NPDC078692]|uniref:type IV toxin-antitoxin system AbiEi family antitoxin domain-containing protein n=1 Tax=Specibacter sp. NPDC078692 TaxID=3155818 RepID=UPI00343BE0E1
MQVLTQQELVEVWPWHTNVATTAQLADAGLGDRAITAAIKRGHVLRLRKGAYVRVDYWLRSSPWQRDKLRLVAHILTAGGMPVYSHFSAALLHGLYVWNGGYQIHVTATSSASGSSSPKDVVRHREVLDPVERRKVRIRSGQVVAVTSLERTVIDCACFGTFEQAVIIGDSALRKGANLAIMAARVESMPGRRGVRKARRVLRALDARSESAGETRTRLVIVQMDIPMPSLQVELFVDGYVYRPDFLWEQQRLIVEFDGDTKYFDYRPTSEVLVEERKRERRLMEAGWKFVRFEWKDLANPEGMKRRILAAIGPLQTAVAA